MSVSCQHQRLVHKQIALTPQFRLCDFIFLPFPLSEGQKIRAVKSTCKLRAQRPYFVCNDTQSVENIFFTVTSDPWTGFGDSLGSARKAP